MATLLVNSKNIVQWQGKSYQCALGRAGILANKKEGDGATPVGVFPLRRVFYRADRISHIATALPCQPLHQNDGWCDAPNDPSYNQLLKLPHTASAESLWREDHVYDIIVEIGFNDNPVVAGAGSAIFLHIARENYPPTDGCIAFAQNDLLEILATASQNDTVQIDLV